MSKQKPYSKKFFILNTIRRAKGLMGAVWLSSLLAMTGSSMANQINIDGIIEPTDSLQTPRLFRSGNITNSTIASPATTSTFSSGTFLYDSFVFSNASGGTAIYSVTTDAGWTTNLFLASYLTSFDPNNITANYLGDPGSSSGGLTYTFEVANGDAFVVVVAATSNGAVTQAYSFLVDGLGLVLGSGPPPEQLSAQTAGLPFANAAGQALISGGQTVLNDINNHLFNLRAGDGEEESDGSLDEGVVVGEGDGSESPIAKRVKRTRQWESFATVNYGNASLSPSSGQAGVQVDSWASGVGIERHISRGMTLGFAVSFLQSTQSYTGGLGRLELEGPALSAYLAYARKSHWSSLLYSFGDYDLGSTRNPGFGFPTASGATRTYTNAVQYNTGWNFRFQENTLVTGPFAGIDYLHGSVDAYSETGGGAAALHYNRQSYESLVTRVGWSTSKKLQTDWATITPQVRLSYERQNLTNNGTSVALVNAPFTATGGNQSPGQSYMVAGAGVNFQFTQELSMLLSYQGQFFRQDLQAHFGSVRLSYKF